MKFTIAEVNIPIYYPTDLLKKLSISIKVFSKLNPNQNNIKLIKLKLRIGSGKDPSNDLELTDGLFSRCIYCRLIIFFLNKR